MTLAATIALVLALLFDAFGLGPRWLGDRLAALCALFAIDYFLAGSVIAGWLLREGQRFTGWAALELRKPLGPKAGEAVGLYGLGMLVFILFVLWVAALWPKKYSKATGEIAHRELNSLFIWGPPVVFVLAAAFIPGGLGDFVRGVIGLLTNAGQAIGSGVANV